MRTDLALGALALTLAFVGGALISYALFATDTPTPPQPIVTAGTTTPPVRFEP